MSEKIIPIHGYHLHIPNENFGGKAEPASIMFIEKKDALVAALSIQQSWWLLYGEKEKTYQINESWIIQEQLFQVFDLHVYTMRSKGSLWDSITVIAEEEPQKMTNDNMEYYLQSTISVQLYRSLADYKQATGTEIIDKESINRKISQLRKQSNLTWSQRQQLTDLESLINHHY